MASAYIDSGRASFLGLAGYYMRFIANFALIAKPLHAMTGKGKKNSVAMRVFSDVEGGSNLVSDCSHAYGYR